MGFHNTSHKTSLMKRVQYLKNGHGLCSLCGQIVSFVESYVNYLMHKYHIIKQSSTFHKFPDFHDVLS